MGMDIKNKKAYFEYEILEKFVAGMQLMGSEVKSIREGKANIQESFCYFKKNELWIRGLHVSEYEQAAHYGHKALRERKLLLTKRELKKLQDKTKEKGLTIVALKLFLSGRGWVKLEVGLAKGKKIYDKRNTIKDRDAKRDLDRIKKLNR
tara:strand:+ start:294 stop:743 length:450 start_codon:yes stop_codon:yes gene_type:complete